MRNIQSILFSLAFILISLIAFQSCTKRDAPLSDNEVKFETNQQGIGVNDNTINIRLKLSRATDRDITVLLTMQPTAGVEYGTDFTTLPAASNDTIRLNILSGNSEGIVALNKTPGALFYDNDKLVFRIISSTSPVIIGSLNQFTLSFTEIISTGGTITADGGGATYGNKVFFDLSANSQADVLRTSWDLGFYSGADWKVILNSSSAMMARQIDKNDLTQVTATDTLGFSSEVFFSQVAPMTTALPYIDYPDGDLSRTAIADVSANDADNKVYIINRGLGIGVPAPQRGWKKVRILRSATGGYLLQHADIASSTFTTVEIGKNTAYNFNYASFENGLISVEPEKDKWDIAWTYFSNVTNFGGGEVPYLFQDFIIQNRNVQTAKVLNTTKPYAAFALSDVASLTFSTAQ
ncbi:MAG: hypothetical protein EOO04_37185, partial [Chitinophagaceae bacterium]